MSTWKEEYVSRLSFEHPALKSLNVRYTIVPHEDGSFAASAETTTGIESIRSNSGRWPSAETAEAAVEKHRQKILTSLRKALEDAQ
jgi:hypothetical protein